MLIENQEERGDSKCLKKMITNLENSINNEKITYKVKPFLFKSRMYFQLIYFIIK